MNIGTRLACKDTHVYLTSSTPILNKPLSAADTLYIMAGLGLVERVGEDCFTANAITNLMVAMPSAQHGALHLSVPPCIPGFYSRNYTIFQPRTNPHPAPRRV